MMTSWWVLFRVCRRRDKISLGTRDAKRKARKDSYLSGKARKPYNHAPVLSVRDAQGDDSASSSVIPSLSSC